MRPRPVRFYPSRGVAYESHLTPPPHLVGLRVAALDALLDTPAGSEQPLVVVSAVALSEKVPDPKLRPHGFTLRVGELLSHLVQALVQRPPIRLVAGAVRHALEVADHARQGADECALRGWRQCAPPVLRGLGIESLHEIDELGARRENVVEFSGGQ